MIGISWILLDLACVILRRLVTAIAKGVVEDTHEQILSWVMLFVMACSNLNPILIVGIQFRPRKWLIFLAVVGVVQ